MQKTKKFIYDENTPPIYYRPGTSDEILIQHLLIDKQEYFLPGLEASVVFDIGANIDVMAIVLSSVYPKAKIHCFEPEPNNFELLELNTKHLPNVVLHKEALDSYNGETMIYGSDDATNHGGFSSHLKPEKEAIQGSMVKVSRMSQVCDTYGTPEIIKIDCEGAEHNILTDIPQLDKVLWITGELHGVKDFELLSKLSVTHEIQTARQFGMKVWHFQAANREKLFKKVE